jgi:hypothetical protein
MQSERRQLLIGAAATMVAATLGTPAALAESRTALFKQYYDNTDAIHAELHDVLSVDQANEEEAKRKVAKFREESNKWVGDYRNTMSLGRKSFAETYAAINTVQGHYTSRGADAPLAGKVRTAAETKLASAENFLKREKAKDAVPTPK